MARALVEIDVGARNVVTEASGTKIGLLPLSVRRRRSTAAGRA